MTYIHQTCEGLVETFPDEGDESYGLCTNCGEEGELTTVDADPIEELVFVTIRITCIRD